MFISDFFIFLIEMKMYHWSTGSYARHEASGKCFEKLIDLLDNFVEVMIGRMGKKFIKDVSTLKMGTIKVPGEKEISKKLQDFESFLENLKIKKTDTELLNIRDEMLEVVEKTVYLFTLE